MAKPYVRGPVYLFVGVGTGTPGHFTPTYLGTCERAPKISRERAFSKVMNDAAGSELPLDYLLQGMEAFVTGRLTRWNQNVLEAILDPVANVISGLSAGQDWLAATTTTEYGTLMVEEGYAYPLWVVYPYGKNSISPKAAMSDLPPGLHFYATFLDRGDESEGGTDPATEFLTWHCVRTPVPFGGVLTFQLGDTDMTGLPAVN